MVDMDKNGGGSVVPPTTTPDLEAGEGTPLVSGGGDGGTSSSLTDPPPLKDMKAESVKEQVVMGFSVVGFSTSVLSLIMTSNPLMYISGIFGGVLSPYAAFQQQKMTQVEAMEQLNDVMDTEVQTLTTQNERLSEQVRTMEESIMNLQAMEETLETLQSMQGQSLDELENQVEESKEILKRMELNREGQILQTITSVILAADTDGDMLLSDDEIDVLIHNIESIQDVDLNDELLKKTIIDQGRDVYAFMELARNLMTSTDDQNADPDGNPQEHIFSVLKAK